MLCNIRSITLSVVLMLHVLVFVYFPLITLLRGGGQGPDLISYQYRNTIVEIRRSYNRLISTMGFHILLKYQLYIESGPSAINLLIRCNSGGAERRHARLQTINTLRPRQIASISHTTFPNAFYWMKIYGFKISMTFVPNIPPLVQITAWLRPGDKPLTEPMMVCLLTHICVIRPQWVKRYIAWLGIRDELPW